MQEKEFNLLQEPWILVITLDGKVEEHSLIEVLAHAHEYRRLAGELPTQDLAIMRLLLAVLQTVVYRYNVDGKEALPENAEEAVARWTAIWRAGRLPIEQLNAYLQKYAERFWLFHPIRPFYQVPGAHVGTEGTAAKLNGEISQSNNKIRLFASRKGVGSQGLTYAEAARWLLYLNGFDDTAAKPKGKGLPSPGAGWLGKLGIVFAEGDNLFETLLLNLVIINTKEKACWEIPKPTWEAAIAKSSERTEINLPTNQAELLTLQSRRILLQRKADKVTGYTLLGGDFFPREAALSEQMTFWKESELDRRPVIVPRRNDRSKQMWRDFANLVICGEQDIRPGIVRWIEYLKGLKKIDKKKYICFRTASVQYGDKDFFVTDIFGDYVSFSLGILTEAGSNWSKLIKDEIVKCDEAAKIVADLDRDLRTAAGAAADKNDEQAKEQFYYEIDMPFRTWLVGIDPVAKPDPDLVKKNWRRQAFEIAYALGRSLLEQAGEEAFVGRMVTFEKSKKTYYYSAPKAFNVFAAKIAKCFDIKNAKEVKHE